VAYNNEGTGNYDKEEKEETIENISKHISSTQL